MFGLALSSIPTELAYLCVISKASKIIIFINCWLMMPFSLVADFMEPMTHYGLHKNPPVVGTLSLIRPISSPLSLISTLILSHIRPGFPSDSLQNYLLHCPSFLLFNDNVPTLYSFGPFLFCTIRATCLSHLMLLI
jgi:hypothetical protein